MLASIDYSKTILLVELEAKHVVQISKKMDIFLKFGERGQRSLISLYR